MNSQPSGSLTSCSKQLILVSGLCLFAMVSNAFADEVNLKAGTLVPVRLTRHINGNIDVSGDRFYFQVTADVVENNQIVIAKGAPVQGIVAQATSRKSMGRSGTLQIESRFAEAVDGQSVRLVRDNINVEGRARTGATVAHTVIWGPIGLFAKGRSANVMMDTEYELEVASDILIDPTAATRVTAVQPAAQDVVAATASVRRIKDKFHWAKGIVGDDIVMDIDLPLDSRGAIKSVSITDMLEHHLLEPVVPKSFTRDDSKGQNRVVATFDFWAVMMHAVPGSTGLTVYVELDDGRLARADTQLQSEWKLK